MLNAAFPLVSIKTHGLEFDEEALLLIFLLTIGAVAAAIIDMMSSTIIISINENPVCFTFSSFLFLFGRALNVTQYSLCYMWVDVEGLRPVGMRVTGGLRNFVKSRACSLPGWGGLGWGIAFCARVLGG